MENKWWCCSAPFGFHANDCDNYAKIPLEEKCELARTTKDEKIQEILIKDKEECVRDCLSQNPNLTTKISLNILQLLLEDINK